MHIEEDRDRADFDRHADIAGKDLDERMHTTPWFHSTKLPNVPAKNLVQVGIGGWQVPREAVKVASERETNIITMNVAPAGLQLPISFRRRCDARSFDEVGDAKLPAPYRASQLGSGWCLGGSRSTARIRVKIDHNDWSFAFPAGLHTEFSAESESSK